MHRTPGTGYRRKSRRLLFNAKDSGIADVPTVLADPEPAIAQPPAPATSDDDDLNDAVRRMVEAAYT